MLYTPTDYGSWSGDTFTYSISDGGDPVSATVVLERYSIPSAGDQSFTFVEDTLSYIPGLAEAYVTSGSKRTANMRVVIETLPARGTLFQACFEALPGLYTSLCTAGTTTPMTPITAPGTELQPRTSWTEACRRGWGAGIAS